MYWQEIRSTLFKTLFTHARIGFISDFDGTLSPVVQKRAEAHLAPGNRELLQTLHNTLPLVALISGRAVYDLQERVGIPELVYIGNHGLERFIDHQVIYPPEVTAYRPALEAILKTVHLEEAMELEDKTATLSIHYRQVADPESIEQLYPPILRALAEKYGLHFSQGRMVFELRPPIELNKGTALASLVKEYELDGLIFIGDDTTDADAMRVAHNLREAGTCFAITIGVESEEMPDVLHDYADAFATGTSDVTAFLAWLVEALSAS